MLQLGLLKLQNANLNNLVFFLDFDGSLCPHLEVWEERSYDPVAIQTLLNHVQAQSQGMFWNTGRRVESLASVHEDFLKFSGYFIQGSVFWDSILKKQSLVGPSLPQKLATFYEQHLVEFSSLRLEIKPSSLRIAPYQSASLEEVSDFLVKEILPAEFNKTWKWHVGSRGAELLAVGHDKSFALRDFYSKNNHSKAMPVVVGDDILDRPAIEESIKRGGYAILVGEHCGWATEIEHKAWQVSYCDHPNDALHLLASLK